ncbi:MAG: ABC transporter permease subunit [Gammaproteobacteria bacterium]|nr:ABC transporter permease subunit [Gammaproteobacteria bacterium]
MIFTIALRELRSLFVSPIAWVLLALMQFVLVFFFGGSVEMYFDPQSQVRMHGQDPGITALTGPFLFFWASLFVVLVIPLLTMKVFSEEKRTGSLSLLRSAPVSITEIVLGKFVGLSYFNLILLALISVMPLSLLLFGKLDLGLLAAVIIGFFLLISSYTALGLFISTLTRSPIVAAVVTLLLLLFLMFVDLVIVQQNSASAFSYISLRTHLEQFFMGVFSTKDMLYFIIFIITFLILAIAKLDYERQQG